MNYNQSLFEGVPRKQQNKSRFNRSHEWKGQIFPGKLTPVLLQECMPGDEWTIEQEFMFRFQGLYYPIMHKLTMRADTFWIPNRILWPEGTDTNVGWKKWITEQEEIAPPTMTANMELNSNTFMDLVLNYMGIPLIIEGVTKTETISGLNAFPLSAYLKIWDEYYRNPQLEDERWFPLVNGDNTAFNGAFGTILNRYHCFATKWEMDYFTSALPQPQLGDEIVIPTVEDGFPKTATIWKKVADGTASGDDTAIEINAAGAGVAGGTYTTQGGASGLYHEHDATIKQLRLAETLQAFYERVMKVGTRYRDYIKGLFQEDPEPGVVDVPVLIRSTFGRVQVSDVLSTADTGVSEGSDITGENVGNYRGNMNLYDGGGDKIRYDCREHGFIMTILQINPNTSYGQGIHRLWRRSVQTDYPLDIFSGIGDQEILKEEVLYNPITAQLAKNDETFGYIPRHSEMRYQNNIHVGRLNHFDGVSMHAGRIWDVDITDWDTEIEINAAFVGTSLDPVGNPTTVDNGLIRYTDIWKVLPVSMSNPGNASQGVIFAHIFHSIFVNRALPMYATPGKGI